MTAIIQQNIAEENSVKTTHAISEGNIAHDDSFLNQFKVNFPPALVRVGAASTEKLEELRQNLDCAAVRNDSVLANSHYYRTLLYDLISYASSSENDSISIHKLRMYFGLKEALTFILKANDNQAKTMKQMNEAHMWFSKQKRSIDKSAKVERNISANENIEGNGISRECIKVFHDHSERSMRFSSLQRLQSIETRDLIASHATRTNTSKRDIVKQIKCCRYAPRSNEVIPQPSLSEPCENNDDASTFHKSVLLFEDNTTASKEELRVQNDLNHIWLSKRQQEDKQRQMKMNKQTMLDEWTARRARFNEQDAYRQEAFLLKQQRMNINKKQSKKYNIECHKHGKSHAQTDDEHFEAVAYSGKTAWKQKQKTSITSKKNTIIVGANPNGAISKLVTLPALKWRLEDESDSLQCNRNAMSPMQIIEQRPGSTRTLFKPETEDDSIQLGPRSQPSSIIYGVEPTQNTSDSTTPHVQRTNQLLQVDAVRDILAKHGVPICRAALERALVQPLASLTDEERITLFPHASARLMENPFAITTMGGGASSSKAGKSSKKGKGKGKGKKKK